MICRARFLLLVALLAPVAGPAAGRAPDAGAALAAAIAPAPPAMPAPPVSADDPEPARDASLDASLDAALATDSAAAAADEPPGVRVAWRGDPIPVPLKVNAERRIDFPEPIADLDVPKTLEQQSRIVLTPAGQLHWTARGPFAPARVLATSVGGTLYQLDLSAQPEGAAPARLILTDPLLEAAAAKASAPDRRARLERAAAQLVPDFLKGEAGSRGPAGGASYVALARYALAHYAGPARLIPSLEAAGVAVRPIDTRAWLRVQSAYLTIRPLRQWKIGALHVTALGVYNRGAAEIAFDPRALRGNVLFAATLHPTLGPNGGGHNGTVWAVVTQQPFNQALHDVPALAITR